MDSHAKVPGWIPSSDNETLLKFPKILFLFEEQLSMLNFIMRCLSVGGKAMTSWWKSHDQVVEK